MRGAITVVRNPPNDAIGARRFASTKLRLYRRRSRGGRIRSKSGCGQGLTRSRFAATYPHAHRTREKSHDVDSSKCDPSPVRRSTTQRSGELLRSVSVRPIFPFGRGNCRWCRTELALAGSSGVTPYPGVSTLHGDDVQVHEARDSNAEWTGRRTSQAATFPAGSAA